MPTRLLPRTDSQHLQALEAAKRKLDSLSVGERHPLTIETVERLEVTLPLFRAEVAGRQSVVGQQAEATSATDICKADLRLTISHFLQNVNMSILRGKYGFRPGDRTHYGLDVNQENLPKMDRESDLLLVAKTVVDGDAKRLEAGGTPILMPSSGEISGLFAELSQLLQTRKQLVAAFDKESADVARMRDDVADLVKDIWDEVEFAHRKDPASALRRRCREWGLVYVDKTGKEGPEEKASDKDAAASEAKAEESEAAPVARGVSRATASAEAVAAAEDGERAEILPG